jgi:hypothetical protein
MLGQSSFSKDEALRMAQARRENKRAPGQNNNKVKAEQQKLSKTYLST